MTCNLMKRMMAASMALTTLGGVLFSSCTATIDLPSGIVDVSDDGVVVQLPGLNVDVSDDGVSVELPGLDVDVSDDGVDIAIEGVTLDVEADCRCCGWRCGHRRCGC